MIEHTMRYTFAGSPGTVEQSLRGFLQVTQADELMINVNVFDQPARLHSLTLTAAIRDHLASGSSAL
jgi:hypothetical protein